MEQLAAFIVFPHIFLIKKNFMRIVIFKQILPQKTIPIFRLKLNLLLFFPYILTFSFLFQNVPYH